MADEEFGDEIDWSTVDLPSISSSMMVAHPRSSNTNPGAAAATFDGYHHSGTNTSSSRNNNLNNGGNDNHSNNNFHPSAGGWGASSPDGTGMVGVVRGGSMVSPSNHLSSENEDALRRQIQELETKLQTKEDLLFEYEASAATSAAESSHRARTAETEAQKRIHQVEEELRRVKMEADSYKGSWVRQKKRVMELEQIQMQTKLKNMNGAGDKVEDEDAANQSKKDVNEMLSGSKRKIISEDASIRNNSTQNVTNKPSLRPFHPHSNICHGNLHKSKRDSSRQRLAHHLLLREETGSYSLHDYDSAVYSLLSTHDSTGELKEDLKMDAGQCNGSSGYGKKKGTPQYQQRQQQQQQQQRQQQQTSYQPQQQSTPPLDNKSESNNPHHLKQTILHNYIQREFHKEKETKSFVTSLLHQMIDAPMEQDYTSIHSKTFSRRKSMPHSLSVSGLVYALLVRFNSIFQNVNIDHGEGEESDAVAEQEKDQQHCLNEQHLPTSFGRSEKGYKGMAVLVSNEPSSKMTMLAPLSWRAILYLLHILNDVLVLSGKSRTDLRLWLYRSRHCLSATGGSRYCGGSNDNFHGSNDSANVNKEKMKPHPRIEGLPARYSSQCRTESGCREALWTVNCRSSMSDETKVEWDPMTMPQSCNTFFEILVGLMKGNVFGYSRMENHVESSFLGMEKMIVQLVQRKAIDLVSKLMSDAPPFDHAKFSQGNPTTPYLWKFWFDSLLPLYSQTVTIATDKKAKASASLTDSASNADAAQQAASDQLLKNDLSPGDFFSIWDKMAQRSGNEIFLNYTELLKPKTATNSNIPPTKGRSSRGNHNVSSASETARRELDTTPQELKYREQLLSVDIKCRTLNLLSFLIFSSSSIHHNLYQQPSMSHGLNDASSGILCQKETTNLARRILIAIIDEVDGCILPCMSANATSGSQIRDLEQCLQLCHACVHFLLVLCQSDEGIQTVRLQLRLDLGQGDHSRWSSSAISCMILILKSTLSHAMAAEENESKAQINSDISVLLNTIVAQCIIFFKTLLLFVHNQQHQQPKSGSSYSKYGTTSLLALISEKRLDFLSCCHNILSHDSPANTNMLNDRSLFHISDDLKHDVRMLLEEVLIDEDEEKCNER